MVELQFINKILTEKSLEAVWKYGVDASFFSQYPEEFQFIVEHFNTYQVVPDKETIAAEFESFTFVKVGETFDYLFDRLHEQKVYGSLVPILQQVADKALTNSYEAVECLRANFDEVVKVMAKSDAVIDIIDNSVDRLDTLKARMDEEHNPFISTGLEDLDKVMLGWMPGEELALILGRTNEGKSWILHYFLLNAWKQGKKVLLYSGEMSPSVVGYRFDTLNAHFSNIGLTGASLPDMKAYEEYISQLEGAEFNICTPKTIGGQLTVPKLADLIHIYQPDIVGIDQLSLMDDARASGHSTPKRIQLTHISEDLFALSERTAIPILTPVQARRADKKAADETPELDEIFESDGIGQNASRVLAIRQLESGLKISIRKNRYGENNRDWVYAWDINRGIIESQAMASSQDDAQEYGDFAPTHRTGTSVF